MVAMILISILVVIIGLQTCENLKQKFKISYYETRLKNNGIDIEHIKDMSLIEMFKA